MALLTCPECDEKVSSKADKCVHCGLPLEPQDDSDGSFIGNIIAGFIFVAILAALFGYFS